MIQAPYHNTFSEQLQLQFCIPFIDSETFPASWVIGPSHSVPLSAHSINTPLVYQDHLRNSTCHLSLAHSTKPRPDHVPGFHQRPPASKLLAFHNQ